MTTRRGAEYDNAKMLKVEDDDQNVRMFVRAVMESEGWRALEARTGREPVDMAEAEMPDLIILDVMMRVMGGFEAFRRLRESPFTGRIPIIMFTGYNAEKGTGYTREDLEAAFGVSAPEGFVDKPVDAAHLLHCVLGVVG